MEEGFTTIVWRAIDMDVAGAASAHANASIASKEGTRRIGMEAGSKREVVHARSPRGTGRRRRTVEGTVETRPRPSRRKTASVMLWIASTIFVGGKEAVAANDAVLEALRARERQMTEASQADVAQRLDGCVEQAQRVRLLVQVGDMRSAREQLRTQKLSHLRLDIRDASEAMSKARPSFERFEAMEVVGVLEALDASLRREAKEDALSEVDMLLVQLREISQELAMAKW